MLRSQVLYIAGASSLYVMNMDEVPLSNSLVDILFVFTNCYVDLVPIHFAKPEHM